MSILRFLLKDRIIRICIRQADLVRQKNHQKFNSCDMSVNILTVHCRNLETETLAVRSLEAHVVPILQLRGLME